MDQALDGVAVVIQYEAARRSATCFTSTVVITSHDRLEIQF